jgi:predicted acetyltransferase
MQIEIVKATLEQEPLAKSLWELFLHDLSEFTDESWMGNDGEWQPPWGKWERPPEDRPAQPEAMQTVLVHVDHRPAGCATVAFAPRVYITPGRDVCMAGFFILKGYRRRGVGRQVAHSLFERFPGKWEVGYMEKNTQAGQFWNAVVAEYTGGNFIHIPVRCAPDADPTLGLHFTSR